MHVAPAYAAAATAVDAVLQPSSAQGQGQDQSAAAQRQRPAEQGTAAVAAASAEAAPGLSSARNIHHNACSSVLWS